MLKVPLGCRYAGYKWYNILKPDYSVLERRQTVELGDGLCYSQVSIML
jgi:hypothetical protein